MFQMETVEKLVRFTILCAHELLPPQFRAILSILQEALRPPYSILELSGYNDIHFQLYIVLAVLLSGGAELSPTTWIYRWAKNTMLENEPIAIMTFYAGRAFYANSHRYMGAATRLMSS
jgi:hypothetical protein